MGKGKLTAREAATAGPGKHEVALAVREALPRVHGNPYLFPRMRQGKPLSNMALLQLMRARDGVQREL